MASSKKGVFESSDVRLATWAKALAHPARIAILRLLARRRRCTCGEIVETLPLSQAMVSRHLKVLRAAGLIDGGADGARSNYSVNEAVLADLRESLDFLFHELYLAAPCYN